MDLTLLAGILAMGIYLPLCIQVLTGKVRQNCATWTLWCLMDAIAAGSIFFQHGSFLLPASYALGSGAVALSILKSRNFAWTWFESFVSGLVVVCLVVWSLSGSRTATIASTAAVMIAGLPLVADCYKKPWEQPFLFYCAFMITNVLGTIGAKTWTVEERLYPAACTVYCLLVMMLVSRKFFSLRMEIQPVSPP